MKRLNVLLLLIAATCNFTSCNTSKQNQQETQIKTKQTQIKTKQTQTFSIKTIEGYWWHTWGHDGYDYILIKSNETCNYFFGMDEIKGASFVFNEELKSIIIRDKNEQIVKTFIYDEENDKLVDLESNYSFSRISKEEFEEISNRTYGVY